MYEKNDLVIENASILTLDDNGTFIKNGVIGVENGVISLLEKQTPDLCCQAKKRIDAQGMLALPGFVNTHVHCFQSLLKGLGADRPLIDWLNSSVQPFGVRVTRRQQELAALVACLEALRSGCTTLCEFIYTNQDPELADVCIETMRKTAGTLETGKKADIILFDPARIKSVPMYDPVTTLVYSASAENIDTTIVNGEVVYRKGVYSCGIDEEQIYREVMDELQII